MNEMKHTGEPWEKDYGGTIGHIKSTAPNGRNNTPTVCKYIYNPHQLDFLTEEEIEANGERIPACVNACAGISNEALDDGVIGKLVEALIIMGKENTSYQQRHDNCRKLIEKIKGKPWSEIIK
jgi:hypothetical protein